jgi:hypothetical protein
MQYLRVSRQHILLAASSTTELPVVALDRGCVLAVVLALCVLASATGCYETTLELKLGQAVRDECPPRTDEQYYFESASLAPFDTANRPVVSQYLAQLDEPSFSCGREIVEGYRLTRVPSATGGTVVVSVAQTGSRWIVNAAEFAAGSKRYDLFRRWAPAISQQQVSDLREAVKLAQLWSVPGWKGDVTANDGVHWFVEARSSTSYRVVARHSPPSTDEVLMVGEVLLRVAGLTPPRPDN